MSLRLSTGLRNALAGKAALPHAALVGVTGHAFADNHNGRKFPGGLGFEVFNVNNF